jgi:hypothetical protein
MKHYYRQIPDDDISNLDNDDLIQDHSTNNNSNSSIFFLISSIYITIRNNYKIIFLGVIISIGITSIYIRFLPDRHHDHDHQDHNDDNNNHYHSNDTYNLPLKRIIRSKPTTTLWGDVQKPYPTGAFWTNLVVDNGDGTIGKKS